MTNRELRIVAGGVFLLCALACGGGYEGNPDPELSVEVDRSSLALTADQGVAREATLVATIPGAPGPIHVSARAEGSGIESLEITSHESYALVTVRSSAALPPGTYGGAVNVVACADSTCAALVGSTVRVPYTLTVLRRLASPNPVAMSAVSGSPAEAAVQVALPPGAEGFEVSVTAGANWLAVTDRTAAGFRVRAASRPRGTYEGSLRVTAGEESTVVQVRYVVSPRPMVVMPPRIPLRAVSGETASWPVSVSLPDDAVDFAVDVRAPGWLSLTGNSVVGLVVQARSLPPGTYAGSITFTAGDSTTIVPVEYTVSAPEGTDHGIVVLPPSVTLSAPPGETYAMKYLRITPPTGRTSVEARYETLPGPCCWLHVEETGGDRYVYANAAPLDPGAYTASVILSAGPGIPEVRVPVAFTVGTGLIRPPDRDVVVTPSTIADELGGSALVEAVDAPPGQGWRATSDVAWLVVDESAGRIGEALVYHVDLAHVAAMAPGSEDVATVTIAAEPAAFPSRIFRVRLSKQLSDVVRVTPYAQPAGRSNRFLVRGRGFDSTTAVRVDGVGDLTATRRSDEELEVTFPALPAGTYTLRIPSALDLPTSSAEVHLFEPGALPYARLFLGGSKRGLAYDPVKRVVYFVNADQPTILRYAFVEGAWQKSQRSIPTLLDIGLAPEGTRLFATTSTGQLLVLDPDTLATRATYENQLGTWGPSFQTWGTTRGVPITNDGRVWLSIGGGSWNQVGYFDLARERFYVYPHPTGSCYLGPLFSMSRDGERLLISHCGGFTSFTGTVYVDAIDGLVRPSPAEDRAFNTASVNDDGGRAILNDTTVYDGEHAKIGLPTVPEEYLSAWTVVSPDGNRIYALALDDSHLPAPPPRIFVFDSSRVPANGPELPILGYFDLPDGPRCTPYECGVGAILTITPDERTLLIALTEGLTVVPIPESLQAFQP